MRLRSKNILIVVIIDFNCTSRTLQNISKVTTPESHFKSPNDPQTFFDWSILLFCTLIMIASLLFGILRLFDNYLFLIHVKYTKKNIFTFDLSFTKKTDDNAILPFFLLHMFYTHYVGKILAISECSNSDYLQLGAK